MAQRGVFTWSNQYDSAMGHKQDADRIERLAEELGLSVDRSDAQTGTVYLTITRYEPGEGDVMETTIRFADHQDAYGRADYTSDGVEGTAAGAREHLLREMRISEEVVRRLRRERSAQASRVAIDQARERIASADREPSFSRHDYEIIIPSAVWVTGMNGERVRRDVPADALREIRSMVDSAIRRRGL